MSLLKEIRNFISGGYSSCMQPDVTVFNWHSRIGAHMPACFGLAAEVGVQASKGPGAKVKVCTLASL